MLGVARNATAGSTYHYPDGGELPAASSRPTATGTHTSEQTEGSLRGGEKDGSNAGAGREEDPEVQVSISLQKRGRGVIRGVWGKEWNPEAILGWEEAIAMAPEVAPRGTTRNPARPRLFP